LAGVVLSLAVYVYLPRLSHAAQPLAMAQPRSLSARLPAALSQFTHDLQQRLSKDADNVFYSPWSVAVALSMTLAGARQRTRDQLASVLRTDQMAEEELAASYALLFDAYKNESSLQSANMLYSDQQFALNEAFAKTLASSYQATAKSVDFKGQSEAVRLEVNGAVEKATHGKITDLIPQGGVNALTALVLVNAVYFKGSWTHKFDVAHTKSEPFTCADGSRVNVPMMAQKAKFRHAGHEQLGARSLVLDYDKSPLSLLVLLPNDPTGLAALEAALPNVPLPDLFSAGHEVELPVKLPRFSLEFEVELVEKLKEMGAVDLVTPGAADLSGMGGAPGDLHVSAVFHKARLDLNEEGAEAAAATAVVMMLRSMPMRVPPFVADRPFLFFLFDRTHNVPLFAGRYSKPQGDAKSEL